MSNDPKHTPGAWKAVRTEDGHVIRMASAIKNPHHHFTAHLVTYDHGESPSSEHGREAAANARLIAAAPDLLAAVRALDAMYARAWDLVGGGLTFSPESVARFEAIHEQASKAIEKAAGEIARKP